MPMVQLTVMVSALLGWSDIDIQPSRGDRAAASYRSVATLDRPTERTVETLRRYNLEREYRRDVNAALLRIEKFAQQRAEPELVYALAELSWIEGQAAGALAQGPGPRPLPRRRRLCLRLPLRPRPDPGPGTQAGRPALPPGHGALQRRRRPPDPRGDDPGRDPDRERQGHHVQVPRQRARSSSSSSRIPPGGPPTSTSCSWPPISRSAASITTTTSTAWACR